MKKKYLNISLIRVLLLLAILSTYSSMAQEFELDSIQVKMMKSLGHEKLQIMIQNWADNASEDDRVKLKHATEILNLESPVVQTINYKNKTLQFVPISHAAKKIFYDNLAKIIKEHKNKGYVVFYEEMKSLKNTTGTDTLRLKFRKIVAIEPTRRIFSLVSLVYPDVIAQPDYNLLGITDKDINADITVAQYIAQYEKLYGPIVLEQCDFEAKIGTATRCKPLTNNLDAITLNFRNENVVNIIKNSRDKKILVIYGAQHIPGMIELLQE